MSKGCVNDNILKIIYSGVQSRCNAHYISTTYIYGVNLSQNFIPYDTYHELEFQAPNSYASDLSNEVLIIDFDQGAAKISKVVSKTAKSATFF